MTGIQKAKMEAGFFMSGECREKRELEHHRKTITIIFEKIP
jgi:hypothetical protein